MLLSAGARLGPYEIVSAIGAGGMGEVYRARDPRTGRDVAIKISSEQFNERLSREVHAVAALNHPNICTLYDVGPNYLVMELVDGPTLGREVLAVYRLPDQNEDGPVGVFVRDTQVDPAAWNGVQRAGRVDFSRRTMDYVFIGRVGPDGGLREAVHAGPGRSGADDGREGFSLQRRRRLAKMAQRWQGAVLPVP